LELALGGAVFDKMVSHDATLRLIEPIPSANTAAMGTTSDCNPKRT
jgi:hypothetical protein